MSRDKLDKMFKKAFKTGQEIGTAMRNIAKDIDKEHLETNRTIRDRIRKLVVLKEIRDKHGEI
tara:strand:+ start:1155 stop:1343 length:189 start_codon:yes stop_codon:yes gene_type:complete